MGGDGLMEDSIEDDPPPRRCAHGENGHSVGQSPVGAAAAAGARLVAIRLCGRIEARTGDLLGQVLRPDEALREGVPQEDVAIATTRQEVVCLGVRRQRPELVRVTLDQGAELRREVALWEEKEKAKRQKSATKRKPTL